MTPLPPFKAGEKAARDGIPWTDNPFPPLGPLERPPSGTEYPGPWVNWLSGWFTQSSRLGRDVTEAGRALQAVMRRAL